MSFSPDDELMERIKALREKVRSLPKGADLARVSHFESQTPAVGCDSRLRRYKIDGSSVVVWQWFEK